MVVRDRPLEDFLTKVREQAARLLRSVAERLEPKDPVTRLLDEAPADDEPVTPEEREAINEAWREVERGETVPLDDVKRKLLA